MILVDTSVWVDHLRAGNAMLAQLLKTGAVLAHPCVTGEVALGNLVQRDEVIALLRALPQATSASDDEVLMLIEHDRLHGSGIGYVDAQLLASTKLTADATLWTRDQRLSAITACLGLAYQPSRSRESRP